MTKKELSERTKVILLDDFSLQITKRIVDLLNKEREAVIMLSVTETKELLELLKKGEK